MPTLPPITGDPQKARKSLIRRETISEGLQRYAKSQLGHLAHDIGLRARLMGKQAIRFCKSDDPATVDLGISLSRESRECAMVWARLVRLPTPAKEGSKGGPIRPVVDISSASSEEREIMDILARMSEPVSQSGPAPATATATEPANSVEPVSNPSENSSNPAQVHVDQPQG